MSGYPTDVTDTQWQVAEPILNQRKSTGRPPTVDRRAVLHALLDLDRTGCQWRMLPNAFPNRTTVRYYFDRWTQDGTRERINDLLRHALRTELDRDGEPEIAVLDSQRVKTSEAGGDRGFAGGKKGGRAQPDDRGRHQRRAAARAGASCC